MLKILSKVSNNLQFRYLKAVLCLNCNERSNSGVITQKCSHATKKKNQYV